MRNNLRKIKQSSNKGITLIALVITIIVLLILAGVSIAMLTGENGILTQAQNAKKDTKIEEEREQIALAYNAAKIVALGEDVTAAGLNAEFTTNRVTATASGSNPIKVVIGENTYTINETTGKITGPTREEIATGKWAEPYVPEGFTPTGEGTWDTGYVIEDDNTGSQFVWIPVGGTINGTKIDLERIFYDDNLFTDEWAEAAFGEGITLERVLTGIYGVTTKEDLWASYSEGAEYLTDFMNSVEENGGFYIGRYEASYLDGKVATVESSDISRSSDTADLTDGMLWNWISQTDALAKCEEMYEGHVSEITSQLINSYAWDTALKFIEVVEEKNVDTDSNDWGNYNSSLANTGATSKAVACNIYDLAGNLYEWTTENYTVQETTLSVNRGGFYDRDGASFPAGNRLINDPSLTYDSFGFRPLLFLDV